MFIYTTAKFTPIGRCWDLKVAVISMWMKLFCTRLSSKLSAYQDVISCTISYEVNDLLTSISFYLNFLVIHGNDYIYTYALFHREMRLMDILEYVCKNVYNYRSIAGPEFPYLKGGK